MVHPFFCLRDDGAPVGIRIIPHFHHVGTVIMELFQGAEGKGKVHTAITKGDIFKFSGKIFRDGQSVLQVDSHDVVDADCELVFDRISPGRQVPDVRIELKPGRG